MAREMTEDEHRGFLLVGTCTGKLAIIRADDRSHVRIRPTRVVARADIAD